MGLSRWRPVGGLRLRGAPDDGPPPLLPSTRLCLHGWRPGHCDRAGKGMCPQVGENCMKDTKEEELRCGCADWHRVDEQACLQNICIGMIEFFLCQPPTARWKYGKGHGRATPSNSSAGSYFCVAKSDEDVASYLKFEFAPRPLSIFDERPKRKTDKRGLSDGKIILRMCVGQWLSSKQHVTSCDIASALYRQGKKKAFNLVKHNPEP